MCDGHRILNRSVIVASVQVAFREADPTDGRQQIQPAKSPLPFRVRAFFSGSGLLGIYDAVDCGLSGCGGFRA